MLFDLRGKGRRNTVRVIYASLAILMGGGLVLFGVGSDVSGGLFNAFDDNNSQNVDDTLQKRVDNLEAKVKANPKDAAAWAQLARSRFQIATSQTDSNTGQFTEEGQQELAQVEIAWDKHLALAGDKPDASVANVMVQAFGPSGLNKLDKAVNAMEIVIEDRGDSAGLYAQLAQLAYLAGQTRKGDLASAKAVKLADKDEKQQLKSQLEQFKTQAAAQAVTDATGAGATTTP
jgi:hypothetical protein